MIKVTPQWVTENRPGSKVHRLNSTDTSYVSTRAREFIKEGKIYKPSNSRHALRHADNTVSYIEIVLVNPVEDTVVINTVNDHIYSVSLNFVRFNLEVHKI